MRRTAAVMTTAALAALGCGFGDLDDFLDEFDDYDPCYLSGGEEAAVTGDWVLSGAGSRSGCDLDSQNTARFTLDSRGQISVEQDEDGGLTLVSDLGGFSLTGDVDGACVTFTTKEPGSDIWYEWDGTVDGNVITGEFTGYGPGGCLSEGDFTVLID